MACVTALFASSADDTPPGEMLIVPLLVIGPPVNPVPVATFVTAPIDPLGGLK